MNYVSTKCVKRIETYKIRTSNSPTKAPKKMLLPISFGPSSMSLLYILDNQLQSQIKRMGRTNYELYPVFVACGPYSVAERESLDMKLKESSIRFPTFNFIKSDLTRAIDPDIVDLKAAGIEIAQSSMEITPEQRLQNIFDVMPSSSSKADLKATLMTRLFVDLAKTHKCESILFGDSTTRLAEKTLSETSMGRGFSLPWQVSDGMSPYGVDFRYPLRDLLKKELVTFTTLIEPSLTNLVISEASKTNVSASAKSTTIDDLMAQYFESVEENFPSIVANVVRTTSKLQPASNIGSTACALCGLPVAEGTDGIHGWGGDQSFDARQTKKADDHATLCYGCSRSVNG